VALYHVARGLRWQVREVLDGWTHPGWPGRTCPKPVIQKRYRLRVFGRSSARPCEVQICLPPDDLEEADGNGDGNEGNQSRPQARAGQTQM
jgi:hypothetical protein